MEFALKSEIYCFIHLHSLLRIVFVRNIYYIFAKLSLTNIRPRFSNKPIVHSRHRGRYTQKFKNNHFTFLKNTELRLFNRKESQFNSPVQLSSPAVQSNCPVQLSSPTVQSNCPVQSSPCFVLCLQRQHYGCRQIAKLIESLDNVSTQQSVIKISLKGWAKQC